MGVERFKWRSNFGSWRGPNGSGKTTFAEEFLTRRDVAYLSADLIAAQKMPANPAAARIAAGRAFFRQVDECLERGESFLVESTLSGRTFRGVLDRARALEYEIVVIFIYLDSVDTSVARVRERVRKGGHDVPEPDIRRRFARSLTNFWRVYRNIADHWMVVSNINDEFSDAAIGHGDDISVRDELLFRQFLRWTGVETDG